MSLSVYRLVNFSQANHRPPDDKESKLNCLQLLAPVATERRGEGVSPSDFEPSISPPRQTGIISYSYNIGAGSIVYKGDCRWVAVAVYVYRFPMVFRSRA